MNSCPGKSPFLLVWGTKFIPSGLNPPRALAARTRILFNRTIDRGLGAHLIEQHLAPFEELEFRALDARNSDGANHYAAEHVGTNRHQSAVKAGFLVAPEPEVGNRTGAHRNLFTHSLKARLVDADAADIVANGLALGFRAIAKFIGVERNR